MRLAFTEEQDELRSMVRSWLADACPESEVRRLMASAPGFSPQVWGTFAGLGLAGLTVPEEYGGTGGSWVELGVVLEELGASLACLPVLSSVVLAQSLLTALDDAGALARWLPGLASGSLRGAVALPGPVTATPDGPAPDGSAPVVAAPDGPAPVVAAPDGAGWRLDGDATYVLDGHTADLLLVAAGDSVYAVEAAAEGLVRAPLDTLDQTRKQATLSFTGTPATLVGAPGAGPEALARTSELAAVALAAESVGGARAVLAQSVAYAGVRVQFGRPIGSFQAVKHRCADMLLRTETARVAAHHALWTAAGVPDGDDLATAASLAKAYCTEAFARVAADNIQVHGGTGFTWEHPAHLYYKRAVANQLMFGDPAHHRAALADHLDL